MTFVGRDTAVLNRDGGAVSKCVGPESGRLGVGIQAATDLSRKNG